MDNMKKSLLVIGGGPGGYVAAIRAAQLGMDVTLVEKEHLGGTCLNIGCIPTKALLHAAKLKEEADHADEMGIGLSCSGIDWTKVQSFKDRTVSKLVSGVEGLLRANKVKVIRGTASFVKPKAVRIAEEGKSEIVEADKIIIATGSVPAMPPIEGLRESHFVTDSTGMLAPDEIPSSLLVIGGGVIGIELGCVYHAFGTKVTVVEALPEILPSMDRETAARLREILAKKGITFLVNHKVMKVSDFPAGAMVTVANEKGEEKSIPAGRILCAVGRKPYTDGLDPDAAGIRTERGRIIVNDYLETNVAGVYAIGDCVGKIMLAHTASAMGEIAAENASGEKKVYHPACVPSGIYSLPEAAGVGATEEELKTAGIKYHKGTFPLSGNGRALIEGCQDGYCKVLIGDELGEVLGVHLVAPQALEMIESSAMAISLEATVDEIIGTVHPHPTVTEAVREAALSAEGRAIHMPNKKGGK